MNDEIDLGHYLRRVLRHFRLGLVLFLLVAGVIMVGNALRPTTYQATATILTAGPQYQWRFDTRVVSNIPVNKNWQQDFVNLVKDPWMKGQIDQMAAQSLGRPIDGNVTVRAGQQIFIHIDATAGSSEDAVALANAWAEAFVAQVERLYGTSALQNPFVRALDEWEQAYSDTIEAARVLKAETGIGIAAVGAGSSSEAYEWLGPLGFQLAQESRLLADSRTAIENLEVLQSQVQSAVEKGGSLDTVSWQLLDVPAIRSRGMLTADTILQQLDDPAGVAAMLDAELTAQRNTVAALEPRLSELQQTASVLSVKLDRIVDERFFVKETYQILRRKVDEITLQQEMEGPIAQVVTRAQEPAQPASKDWPLAALLALVAGVVIGAAGAFLAEAIESRRRPA